MAYVMNAPYKDCPARPSKFYLDGILQGCGQNGIPVKPIKDAVRRTGKEVTARNGKSRKKAGNGNQIGRAPCRYRILQAAFVLVFCIGVGMLYYHLVAVPKANREMAAQLKEDFPGETLPEEAVPENQPAGEKSDLPPLVDLASLQEQYPDVKGWLTIPETGIDYPVLQSGADEPEYYIHRNYKGEPDINGSLFLQWDCDVREGENLVVYGHNMNSGVMFGNLDRYADREYYEAHRYAYFQTLEGVQEYEIVSAIEADHTTFPFQRTGFGGTEGMQEYLGQAKRMALFDNGENPSVDDVGQVLTLVTCSYEWNGARNIVVAVRENSGITEKAQKLEENRNRK